MLPVNRYDEFGVPEEVSDVKSGDEVRRDIENITKNSGDNALGDIQNITPKLTGSEENKEVNSIGKEIQKEESKSVRDEKCNDEMAVEKIDTERKVDEKNEDEKELAQIMNEIFTYRGTDNKMYKLKLSRIISAGFSWNLPATASLRVFSSSKSRLRSLAIHVINVGSLKDNVASHGWKLRPYGVTCHIEICAALKRGTLGLEISVVMSPDPDFAHIIDFVDKIDLIIISEQYGVRNTRKLSGPNPNTLNKSYINDSPMNKLVFSGFVSWNEIVNPSTRAENNKIIILVIINGKSSPEYTLCNE